MDNIKRLKLFPFFLTLLIAVIGNVSAASANLKWKYQTGGEINGAAVIGTDGTVYVGSYDGYVYALASDGTLKWKYQTGDQIASSPAIGSDNTIYISSRDENLYAIKPDGTLKWKYKAGTSVSSSSPAVGTDGTVYIGSDDNNLYAVNSNGTLKWKFETGSYISSSPAVAADGTVYVGSDDRNLYAVNSSGTLKWKFETQNYVSSSPAVAEDGTVFVGSDDNYLYAVNPDGTLKWKYQTQGVVYSSPAVGNGGTVYVGSCDKNLYAVNSDGTLKWKFEAGNRIYASPTVGTDGTIFVGSDDKKLYAINPEGTLKQKYQTLGYISSAAVIGADGTVFIGSDDGRIYAIEEIPVGSETGSDVVGLAGNTVFSEDGFAWVIFPVGATSEILHISIAKSESAPNAAEGFRRLGNAYVFSAKDSDGESVTGFNDSVQVGIKYTESSGTDESSLKVNSYSEAAGKWTEMPSVCSARNNTVSAMTSLLTTFGIFGMISNAPPVITSDPDLLAYLSEGYVYNAEAEDEDNDPLTFSLGTCPQGMTIDSSSGMVRWTPRAGEYDVEVKVSDGKSVATQTFTITVDPDAKPFRSGEFTVGEEGSVAIDWLYDGGLYQGELGIFNTAEMESLMSEDDITAYTKEAIKRVLSNSEQGYIVISDPEEGAKFSGSIGEPKNHNSGVYKNVKRFKMNPGDKFATILIPNAKFSSFLSNGEVKIPEEFSEYNCPLYSLESLNPEYGMQMGQAVSVGSLNNAVVYEDADVNAHKEWVDYNDFIVQITGATMDLRTLDDMVGKQGGKRKQTRSDWVDWRTSTDLGRQIMEHINVPPVGSDDFWVSVSLDASDSVKVYDAQNRVFPVGEGEKNLPGAALEIDGKGNQLITLPGIPEFQDTIYRVMVQGTQSKTCYLTVKGYQGSDEIWSETKEISVKAASLSAEITAYSTGSSLSVTFQNPLYVYDATVKNTILSKNGKCSGNAGYDVYYDLNNDGCIGIPDLMLLLNGGRN